jgi:23S rRNA-/tRNA-specific pseudouridylate synthase
MHECASQTPNMLLKKQIFSTRIEKIRRHCQYISHSILVESFYFIKATYCEILSNQTRQFSVSGVPQTLIGDDGYLSFVHVGTELVLD